MPKIRRRLKEKAVRREDEASLYYIIERDLDREALFPENDGWVPQAKTSKKSRHKIDYLVEYDGKLIGIEVKCDYPERKDFAHVEAYYEDSLNAIFLAYPSDRVGEAVSLVEDEPRWRRYGLLSIALFRSHCIRRAKCRETRYDNWVWNELFDKKSFLEDLMKKPDSFMDKIEKRQAVIEICKGQKKTLLRADDWRLMALILVFWDVYGVNKYVNWELGNGLSETYHKIFSGYPYQPGRLERAGLVDSYSYGTMLTCYAPSDEMIFWRPKIEETLNTNHPAAVDQIEKHKDDIKRLRKEGQRLGSRTFLLHK